MLSKILMIAVLVFFGCEKKPGDGPAPTAATTAPSVTARQPTSTADAGARLDTGLADDQWCPTAHDDILKIVEAMKATMKRAGSEGEDDYAPPARARFLELCATLPVPMRKCLVVSHAARNREACQAQLDGLSKDQKAAYAELMGK